ncbi:Opsin-1 [Coccomyxa sp. Obi]|nr:Opsin-1 [Coccomyxa sp. Obi]
MAVHIIGTAGITMYWCVFGLMAGSAICFAVMTFMQPMRKRSHGYITLAIVTIAAIAYYVMVNGGSALVYNPDGNLRSIYYTRYIDWFFTTPLLLLDLILLAGLPLGTTLWQASTPSHEINLKQGFLKLGAVLVPQYSTPNCKCVDKKARVFFRIVLADVAMIMLGLFGAVSNNQYRWGYYGISCGFFLIVLWGLIFPCMKGARARGAQITGLYTGLAGFLCIVWFGYPIVWGFAEGSDTITVTAEACCYGGLDLAAKVVFGWAVMLSHPVISKNQTEGSVLCNYTNDPFVANANLLPERKEGGLLGGLRGKKRPNDTPAATTEAERREPAHRDTVIAEPRDTATAV